MSSFNSVGIAEDDMHAMQQRHIDEFLNKEYQYCARLELTMEGTNNSLRSIPPPSYIGSADPGLSGGGTYTGTQTEPTMEQWESVFGPAA
eukprot:2690039-Rhodomonas_salina.1